jgi:hypothetical protein
VTILIKVSITSNTIESEFVVDASVEGISPGAETPPEGISPGFGVPPDGISPAIAVAESTQASAAAKTKRFILFSFID